MAVLKHIASKNPDYGRSLEYLMFQHDEKTQKPLLDECGHMVLREEYYLDGLNCDPFSFDMECRQLNALYHKNQKKDEIKSHHYIIGIDTHQEYQYRTRQAPYGLVRQRRIYETPSFASHKPKL